VGYSKDHNKTVNWQMKDAIICLNKIPARAGFEPVNAYTLPLGTLIIDGQISRNNLRN
jgi:hypothetical protein